MASVDVSSARAGEYVMRNCNVPGHAAAPIGPWTAAPPANMLAVETCSTGGGFGFRHPATRYLPGRAYGTWNLTRPAGPRGVIQFTGARMWFVLHTSGSGGPMWLVQTTRTMYSSDYPPNFPAGGAPDGIVEPGDTGILDRSLTMSAPEITEAFGFGLGCGRTWAQGPWADCYGTHETPLLIHGAEVTLSEDVRPSASIVGGTLLADGQQSGMRDVRYSARDLESGLARVDVLIDENVVASRDLTVRCAYADFTACPTSDDATMAIDTRTLANGAHRLVLRVQDAAGNKEAITAPGSIQIANADGAHAHDSGQATSSMGQAARLTARRGGSARATLIVPFGRRVTLTGRLSTASNVAIGGAILAVLERRGQRGAREKTIGRAQTRADGRFSFRLAARRPSRTLRVAFRPSVGSQALSSVVRLRVRAAASLRVSLRGARIRFAGRVLSAPIPADGKRVVLQGRAPGFTWAPFASVRTDRKGRFAGTFRLTARRPGVTLQIRAVVPTEPGYPYLSYQSRPTGVRVR